MTALLAELGAVSTPARSLDNGSNIEPMSTEEAESFGGDGVEAFRSDVELMEEHNMEDFKSSVTKVCCCIFVHLSSFNSKSVVIQRTLPALQNLQDCMLKPTVD